MDCEVCMERCRIVPSEPFYFRSYVTPEQRIFLVELEVSYVWDCHYCGRWIPGW